MLTIAHGRTLPERELLPQTVAGLPRPKFPLPCLPKCSWLDEDACASTFGSTTYTPEKGLKCGKQVEGTQSEARTEGVGVGPRTPAK